MTVVVTVLAIGVGSAQSEGSAIEASLTANGVDVLSVAVDQAAKAVVVDVASKDEGSPDDAWARAMIERELASRKQSGGLSIDTVVTVNFLDQEGNVVYGVSDLTVDPFASQATPPIDPGMVAEVKSYAEREVSQKGLALLSLQVAQTGDGNNVLQVGIAVSGGEDRDGQIQWIVRKLMGSLARELRNKGAVIYLSRVSIEESGTGRPLVDMVSQADRKSVRAWSAPDVPASWALFPPSAGPGSQSGQ